MRSLAIWCHRHRLAVVLIWVAILVGTSAFSGAIGTAYSNSPSLPNTESTHAFDLLKKSSPKLAGDTEDIVIATSGSATVYDPAVRSKVDAMLKKVEQLPHVSAAEVSSPYDRPGQVSADHRIAFIRVPFDVVGFGINQQQAKAFVDTATAASGPGLKVAVAGQIAEQANPPALNGTLLGIILAGVVLLLVFGSIWAMLLPLLSALASLGTAIAIIGMLSNVLQMPDFSLELVLLIGLGVGVDYALFIVTRHRQGLVAGRDVESSIATAVDTSGRAVLFAGIVVCIALLGMFAIGVKFLYGLAIAASLGVAFTMVAALTLLPAMLGFIGPRVMSRKQRRTLREQGPKIVGISTKGFWPSWADRMRKHPVLPALAALGLIVLLTIPFAGLRLGHVDSGGDPTSTTTRQAYDLLAKGFGPGFNGPLQLVALTSTPAQAAGMERAVAAAAKTPGVAAVTPVFTSPVKGGETVRFAFVYPTSSPQDKATTDLIGRLRTNTIPTATQGTGTRVFVGGITAIFADFSHVLGQKLLLFIGLVVLLSFLLLALVFRSLLIPLVAAVMNLLSIGAAFGIMVAVFQHGVGASLIGVSRTGPIEPFIPVMMFAILFGLSMDYEVFLVSRIHEEWLRTGDNATAVRNGLAATGKTITAAALIMILVFGSFVLGGVQVIKEFGLGLAAGIVVDAVIIRMALVPSVMQLLGRANWWFPKGLDRVLPKISVEPDEHAIDIGEGAEAVAGA